MENTFGQVIRQARKNKGYSQRELAKLIGIDFTYLSKLENNRADYPPKEDVIKIIAQELQLDCEELIFLAGRIPSNYSSLLQEHYQTMPVLFRRIREDSQFAAFLSDEMEKNS
ncbi:MAG: helix-turn-helix transcriptional regulator [Prochloraceae cyanobacterium]|nr:helix-turn-helix transcriptional regulator [Prochloraceae cyanobacterium]